MRWLLDTHILLWAAGFTPDARERLPVEARAVITNDRNEVVFSAVAVLEVAIKAGRGRIDFDVDAERFRARLLASDYRELGVTGQHAAAVARLPPIHRDPFDRLLVAQATAENITLLTADATIARYPGPIRLV